nr:retrovirus-related Pol polyprotein from transposon TNT 1-94 [Tanacetum cinerariifolium]
MIMPYKDTLYNGQKGTGFENSSYFEKEKDLRPSLYDEKVIGLGYTPMFLTHSDKALEIEKFKRVRENKIEFAFDYGNLNANIDTFSSVRRPMHNGVIWKKKGSSNTSNVDLSSISHLKLNKDVKRYSHKDLLSCNNSYIGERISAYVCSDAKNVSCNSRLYDSFNENNLFIFDDESVRISPVSKMFFRKKTHDSMNVRSKSNSNISLPRTVHRWLPKMQQLAKPIAKWIPKVKRQIDTISKTPNSSGPIFKWVPKVCCMSLVLYLLQIVQICLWIIDSGCSKHMTGNRALLTNFVEKFLKTVRFGNNDFAMIAGYGITPQQNGVVERRNRTLIEVARTMLTFANLPLFLWAEAIATACFTQNRSIIHKRFDKTPYELMNKRKPKIKFFRVFECRCYLFNDYEDVGKLKVKGDIGVFVGYSKESAAFIIYNKRTRKIHESVNVNFDEISEMASKQFSLELGLSNFNETGKFSYPSISQVSETSKKDLEDLF